jgi:hypothetical protein
MVAHMNMRAEGRCFNITYDTKQGDRRRTICPHRPIAEVFQGLAECELVWDGVSTIIFNPLQDIGGLLRFQESVLFREVGNVKERDQSAKDGDSAFDDLR